MSNRNVHTSLIDLNKTDLASDARRHDPAALEILAHDMKEQGQLQEIVVESKGSRFMVIAGVGRTLAARKLGWKEIRASVRENVSDFERARITFAENEDRENVDAFYQAFQLDKMLKAKKCTQKALAKDLGISDSLISSYVVIHKLPEKIKSDSRRLELGLLTQIARLNGIKSQIWMAKKCATLDASVRQVKTWVDKKLGMTTPKKSPRPVVPQPPDPLGKTWDKIKDSQRVAPDIYWETQYGPHKMPNNAKRNGWFFFVMPQEGYEKKGLARWFREMASALDTKEPAMRRRGDAEKGEPEMPEALQELQDVDKQLGQAMGARFPKNAAEEKELTLIATRGTPKDVYAWIYGKDSPMTQMVPFSTWKESGQTPQQGLKTILTGIKQLQ